MFGEIISARNFQGRRGQWAVYHASPKSFIITFSYLLAWQLGDFYWTLIGWFNKLSLQTFQSLIIIYRRSNFVYHHWGYKSIYLPFSYPFRYPRYRTKKFLGHLGVLDLFHFSKSLVFSKLKILKEKILYLSFY